MSWPKGKPRPKREVPCTRGCGRTVLRAVHFVDAICPDCARETEAEGQSAYFKRIRLEARRYRVLMTVGPYRTFEELYRAIRIRGPFNPPARPPNSARVVDVGRNA